jgi:hypothetical protein
VAVGAGLPEDGAGEDGAGDGVREAVGVGGAVGVLVRSGVENGVGDAVGVGVLNVIVRVSHAASRRTAAATTSERTITCLP